MSHMVQGATPTATIASPGSNPRAMEWTNAPATRRSTPYYHRELIRLLRMHIPTGASVLQVGCGSGDLLAGLQPKRGVGIDVDASALADAARRHPNLVFIQDKPEAFVVDETFDYVVISDAINAFSDVQAMLDRVRAASAPGTRVILAYVSALWEPVLELLTVMRLRRKTGPANWLSTQDMKNLLRLSGFEVVCHNYEMLLPAQVPLLSVLCNRVLARIWPTQHLALIHMLIARPDVPPARADELSCSVIIPTLNERGNIAAAVERTPHMGTRTELIFVDGGSTDGTVEEIRRVMAEHPNRPMMLLDQGAERGKGAAVRKGFAEATGDVVMILDSDLTVMPEDLPKFFRCIAEGRAEFVNGTRLVYPMEQQAMRSLNRVANWFFSVLFGWLLRQKFRDTLCGTKALLRSNYERIAKDRAYFGDIDPFGDFDLLFGAAKANLKIMEVPVRYRARTYGSTEIHRFRHGLLLLRMSLVALRKLRLR